MITTEINREQISIHSHTRRNQSLWKLFHWRRHREYHLFRYQKSKVPFHILCHPSIHPFLYDTTHFYLLTGIPLPLGKLEFLNIRSCSHIKLQTETKYHRHRYNFISLIIIRINWMGQNNWNIKVWGSC